MDGLYIYKNRSFPEQAKKKETNNDFAREAKWNASEDAYFMA